MVSGKDILWCVSLPFRIKNNLHIHVEEYINILVFETFDVVTLEIAKKLITMGLEKGFIEVIDDNINYLLPDVWKPVLYKLDWVPNFEGMDEINEFELNPLQKYPELIYIPKKSRELDSRSKTDFIDDLSEAEAEKIVKKEPEEKKSEKKITPEKKIEQKSADKKNKREKKSKQKKLKSLDEFF